MVNDDVNELQNNSKVESPQSDLDCQEIQKFSDNGENIKDEEDCGSVEKALDEVMEFIEKKIIN